MSTSNVAMLDDDQYNSVFICYAHQDNESPDPKQRWLDRFLQFIKPLVRQRDLRAWSDKELKIGNAWHSKIQKQLEEAKAIVLFVSPAFLESDYIVNNEMPILLKQAKNKGVPIFQIIVSPCLYEETRFLYPNPEIGPDIFSLHSLQAANSPSKTLIEMTEAEQDRVMLKVARSIWHAVS